MTFVAPEFAQSRSVMRIAEFWVFLMAALALLGSPGPAIVALLAIGRAEGWSGGLKFFSGLQVGLALAAGISIAGLFTVISLFPGATVVMTGIAVIYLIYLAYKIASSPVGQKSGNTSISSSPVAGFLLGITNPKAYLAFASLFTSFQIVPNNHQLDSLTKWLVVIAVIIFVDLIWLWIGVRLGQLNLSNTAERALNYFLAATVVAAAALALA